MTTPQLVTDMATALQQAVAMYCLLHEHAQGRTDLTEDQLANVVTAVCQDAAHVLQRARDEGLLPTPPIAVPPPVVLENWLTVQ